MSNEEQLRQLQALQEAVRQAKLSLQPAQLQAAVRALAQLPLTGAEDICTGLQQALATLPHEVTPQQFTQICDLCLELLDLAASRLQATPARKKVMVFLPYKASMWDSLESIWQAASADKEHCEAIVMPIPYCDLTPERQVKEWHYEGPLFPPYVPITHYDSLDLARLHPDVIFIHNPYDGYNRVTSVDSRFYSDALKKCTDKLVYVPYFVTGFGIPEHLCQTAAVINADYVICETEEIKDIYERKHNELAPARPGKFVALGSPKYDKAVAVRQGLYHIPEAWQSQIANSGANFVVLFNTSLSDFLAKSPEQYFQATEEFFVCCQQQRIFILWRPHPLFEATITSMRVGYEQRYQNIKQHFLEKKLGILDTGADMYTAIAATDGYFGDASSLVWLYAATGKPLLLRGADWDRYYFLGGEELEGFHNIRELVPAVRILRQQKGQHWLNTRFMKDDTYHAGRRIYDFVMSK